MGSKLFYYVLIAHIMKWIHGCAEIGCHADPFPVRVIKEVPITHGKAGASSNWSSGVWSKPESAFRQDIKEAWSGGTSSNGVRHPFPYLIWYDFTEEKAFIPAEVTFRTRQDGHLPYGPTKWQFVTTNDQPCNANAAWAILCEDLSGEGYKNNGHIKYCSVPPQMYKKFRCLGIRVLQNGNGLETSVQSIRFWEKVTA